jgi:hypothetical protein
MKNNNLFATATVAPAKKSTKKGAKAEVQIAGLEVYAALDAAYKTIEALKVSARENIDAQIKAYFIREGAALKAQPANFRGIDSDASASCELKKRSVRSFLNEQEVQLLEEAGIPFETIQDKPETFIINPVYLTDTALINKVGEMLGKIEGIPLDFIQKQPAKTTTVVSEESLAALFKKQLAEIETLLPILTVTAVKPTLAADKTAEALRLVAEKIAEEAKAE